MAFPMKAALIAPGYVVSGGRLASVRCDLPSSTGVVTDGVSVQTPRIPERLAALQDPGRGRQVYPR